MTRGLAALAALACLTIAFPARAESPKGIEGFAWGAARAEVAARLIAEKCARRMTYERLSGDKTIACYDYAVADVGPVLLALDFVDDALHGYRLMVPQSRVPTFRSWLARELGNPAESSRQLGEVATWSWPGGTTAVFTRHCLSTVEACLTVTAPRAAAEAKRH